MRSFGLVFFATTLSACGPTLSEELAQKVEVRIEEARQSGMTPSEIEELRNELGAGKALVEAFATQHATGPLPGVLR